MAGTKQRPLHLVLDLLDAHRLARGAGEQRGRDVGGEPARPGLVVGARLLARPAQGELDFDLVKGHQPTVALHHREGRKLVRARIRPDRSSHYILWIHRAITTTG